VAPPSRQPEFGPETQGYAFDDPTVMKAARVVMQRCPDEIDFSEFGEYKLYELLCIVDVIARTSPCFYAGICMAPCNRWEGDPHYDYETDPAELKELNPGHKRKGWEVMRVFMAGSRVAGFTGVVVETASLPIIKNF